MIEEGGVWSVPVEEFRMQNPPHPDARGNIDFEKRKAGDKQIEGYTVGETIDHLNAKIVIKYNKEKGHSGDFGNAAKMAGKMSKSVMQLISIGF